MISAKPSFLQMINSVSREIEARVELLDGSTILNTFTYDGALQNLSIDRTGSTSCFFGFGICQKLTLKLRDKERKINVTKGQYLDVAIGVGSDYLYPFPVFIVDEITRDENTNALTIVAYDAIYRANGYKVSDMTLQQSYTIYGFATAAASLMGTLLKADTTGLFATSYQTGANFEGTESLREALDDVAEATGTIYYINHDRELVFKTLDISGDSVLAIDKSKYFTLSAKTKYTLTGITSATELGDNVTVGTNDGAHQYLRDNAFLELRDDIATLLESILAKVQNLSMYQFDLKFRGNFLLEIGDKVSITTKDNGTIDCYLVNDKVTYNGGLVETMSWSYNKSQGETASNPSNIGDAIKQTYARVDKVNKKIELVVSDVDNNAQNISQLQMDTNNIRASVTNVQTNLDNMTDSLGNRIDEVAKKAELSMTPEQVQIKISEAMAEGVTSVTTQTGFTFDSEGLTISKNDSEMSTNIDENGMSIFKNGEEVLTADNTGVNQINCTIRQYLVIGNNSRFEDYGSNRTACFYIGN